MKRKASVVTMSCLLIMFSFVALGSIVPSPRVNGATATLVVLGSSSCTGTIGGSWDSTTSSCTINDHTGTYTVTAGVTLEIPSGTTLSISQDGELIIDHGGTLQINNGGSLTMQDLFSCSQNSDCIGIENDGVITNAGTFTIGGTYNCSSRTTDFGQCLGLDNGNGENGGMFTNSGTLMIDGTYNCSDGICAGFNSNGYLGSVTNTGTVTIGGAYNCNNFVLVGDGGTTVCEGFANFYSLTNSGTIEIEGTQSCGAQTACFGLWNEFFAYSSITNFGRITLSGSYGGCVSYPPALAASCIGLYNVGSLTDAGCGTIGPFLIAPFFSAYFGFPLVTAGTCVMVGPTGETSLQSGDGSANVSIVGANPGDKVGGLFTSYGGTPPNPGTDANLVVGADYEDVQVVGASGGTATVCFSDSNGATTLQYYDSSIQAWVSVSNVKVSSGMICGDVPVSALSGTLFGFGISNGIVTPEFPLGSISTVLIMIGALMGLTLVRRRSRSGPQTNNRGPLQSRNDVFEESRSKDN